MRSGETARRRGRRTAAIAVVVILVCGATVATWALSRSSGFAEILPGAARTASLPSMASPVMSTAAPDTPTTSPTVSPRPSVTASKRASKPGRTAAAGNSTAAASSGGGSTATSSGRLFSASSPWNRPIPAAAAIDPQSAAISKAVLTRSGLVVNVAIYAYGIPFYTATASTPRVVLNGRGSTGAKVPLDPSWTANSGGDRKLNVLDPSTHSVYELQYFDRSNRSVYWMVKRYTASGLGDGSASGGRRGPTGSGMSQAGGVIRVAELRAGRIDHALSFISSAPLAGKYRYPATSTDGTNSAAVGMQEGMRVQLDPSLDLASLHLSKAEYAIARALQVYGAYCVDNGGGNNQAMGFYAEKPTKSTGDPYASLGLSGDWAQLKGIPRSAYRVLAASVTRP